MKAYYRKVIETIDMRLIHFYVTEIRKIPPSAGVIR